MFLSKEIIADMNISETHAQYLWMHCGFVHVQYSRPLKYRVKRARKDFCCMVHLRKPRNFFSSNLSADKETPFCRDTLHETLSQTFWIDYEKLATIMKPVTIILKHCICTAIKSQCLLFIVSKIRFLRRMCRCDTSTTWEIREKLSFAIIRDASRELFIMKYENWLLPTPFNYFKYIRQ